MSDIRTVTVQYEGGAISEVDVPAEGTPARELFDSFVANGTYVIIDGQVPESADEPTEVESADEPEGLPDGSIAEVTAWVRGADEDDEPAEGWHERAVEARDAELAKGDEARSSLVKLLNSVVG